ncbi:MAG: terminase small subunit [Christensenella sp.]|uniref:terminase small subunit n=1 Tax=Christensenella sp. TaxID=1935934 RepID=UPI002B2157AF|nr:terminase small subunit [Christensenella sp.]MEA5002406.1 terminase small subunit [Christensenella sp.]
MTDRQKRFCSEYLKDLNATQAAIRAGYAPKYADRSASNTMKNEEVRAEIQRALDAVDKNNIAQAEDVLEYLTKLMRGEIYEEKIVIDEETGDEMVLRQPVKVADRTKAAEHLAKHHKMLTDKVDIAGGVDVRVELDGEIREWAR